MAIEIISEVMHHAPVRGGDYQVLMVLADNADVTSREAWPGLEDMCWRSHMDRRSVQRSLRALEEAGLIVLIEKGRRGGDYTPAVRARWRITPVETWPQRTDAGARYNPALKAAQRRPYDEADTNPQVTGSSAGNITAKAAERRPYQLRAASDPEKAASDPEGAAFPTGKGGTAPPSPSRTVKNRKEPTSASPRGDDEPDDVQVVSSFEQFWQIYPARNGRKIGKGQALAQWRKLTQQQRRRAYLGALNLARSDQLPKDAHRFLRRNNAGEFPFDDWQQPTVLPGGRGDDRAGSHLDRHDPHAWLDDQPAGVAR